MADPTNEEILLHELSTVQSVVDEAIANEVLDIREGRSICIHMRQVKAKEATKCIIETIQNWFQKAKISAGLILDFEVYEKPPNTLFDEYFSRYLNYNVCPFNYV